MDFARARAAIAQKLQKAAGKGASSPTTKALMAANQTVFDEALAALKRDGVVIIDRDKIPPKYYLKEFAPSQREAILAKLRKAGAKGAAAFSGAKASSTARAALEREAAALESEGAIVIDRHGAKRKYYLKEFARKLEPVCARLEEFAAAKYPQALSESEFKKALAKEEKDLFDRALYWLEGQREIVRLRHGKIILFASARGFRQSLGGELSEIPVADSLPESAVITEPITSSEDIDAGRFHEAYRLLAEQSGFPSVKIAALRRESGASLAGVHRWLLDEYRQGRAVFSFGDWSLSDEATRAGAIELRGERYLLVKLLQ